MIVQFTTTKHKKNANKKQTKMSLFDGFDEWEMASGYPISH